jgi:hypothetical protein
MSPCTFHAFPFHFFASLQIPNLYSLLTNLLVLSLTKYTRTHFSASSIKHTLISFRLSFQYFLQNQSKMRSSIFILAGALAIACADPMPTPAPVLEGRQVPGTAGTPGTVRERFLSLLDSISPLEFDRNGALCSKSKLSHSKLSSRILLTPVPNSPALQEHPGPEKLLALSRWVAQR